MLNPVRPVPIAALLALALAGGLWGGCTNDQAHHNVWGTGQVQVLEGANPGDLFGSAVALTGDLDGDGRPDLAVGAPGSALGGANSGAVYIYKGNGQGVDPKPAVVIAGGTGDKFGQSLFAPGDLNGDGLADLLVGSAGDSLEARPNVGTAYIFLGNANTLRNSQDSDRRQSITAEIEISEDQNTFDGVSSRGFAARVAAVGDLNGDGTTDIGIGAPDSLVDGQAGAGAVFIFYNRVQLAYPIANLNSSQAGTILRGAAGERFGAGLNPAGDVNGIDETKTEFGNDLIIGAPGSQNIYLFYGGPARMNGKARAADADASFAVEGNDAGYGSDVSGVGDLNHDTYDDVAVSAPGEGGGAVYVYFGKLQSGPLSLDRLRIAGETSGDQFGVSIWGGGPKGGLLRDGLFVGAPGSSFTGPSSGSLYFLDPNGSPFTGQGTGGVLQLLAQQMSKILRNPKSYPGNEEQLGTMIRGGSDFNSDGQGDLVAGAPGAANSGPDTGAVYIFY